MFRVKMLAFVTVTGLASFGLAALPGCATVQPEFSEAWQESQRLVVKDRAEARWQVVIKGDLDAAYLFTTPEYRTVVTVQQYKGKYGRVANWRMARVVNVSYDDPAVATVSVEVAYRISLPGVAGEVVETQKLISEKWIYKNRDWWYTAN